MGRPTKLTPALLERLAALIEAGHPETVAAEALGVGHSTFYRWLSLGHKSKRGIHRDLSLAVDQARAKAELRYMDAIRAAVQSGDPRWAAWWLERHVPERWGRRTRHEVSGPGGDPIQAQVFDFSKMSTDEIIALADRLDREHGGP